MNQVHKGFTLIELVVVIVILGILAATALPKFVDLGKDARIAAVQSLAGTMKSASELAHSKCLVVAGCVGSAPGNGTGSVTIPLPNGNQRYMWFGYPTGLSRTNYSGITDWVDVSGFTVVEASDGMYTDFKKDGAANVEKCKVRFWEIHIANATPLIEFDNSEC